MKAVIQNYGDGTLVVAEVPLPALQPGGALIHTAFSLVSAGTERSMVELARKNLLNKARERPDLVRQVIGKARRDGLLPTIETVRNRLDSPVALGYSSSGTVIGVGPGVEGLKPGDRVSCAGARYATHSEVVFVPQNLIAKLPDAVDFESAAFTTLGAIALQGIRLTGVHLGEIVTVIGLGVLGQLTVQMLKAAGCVVIGMDIQSSRTALALQLGADAAVTNADELRAKASTLSGGLGVDAVLITATSKSSKLVALAGEIAREQGVVVVVGQVGLKIPRKTYYDKELIFRISRSYGPGRYDPAYEEKGRDYPVGYVRWTENRNMQAFIRQIADGKVHTRPLVTHCFSIENAAQAYDLITGKAGESFMGVLLTYPDQPPQPHRIELSLNPGTALGDPQSGSVKIGMLGGGSFSTSTLLPALKSIEGLQLVGICTASGITAQHAAKKFEFGFATSDEQDILSHSDINTVIIATRHHLHKRQVIAALTSGKHVFCEKPLCLSQSELTEIIDTFKTIAAHHQQAAGQRPPVLMVGYNRRFAPMARQLKDFLSDVSEPLAMHYRINAGYIPVSHWTQDPEQGGGRLIGEVCHFVDFLIFIAGALPTEVFARCLPDSGRYRADNLVLTLQFANGSLGTITYVANGDKTFPKERIEVFGGETVAILDNFRQLELVNRGRRRIVRSRLNQDKGHRNELQVFADAIRTGGSPPISLQELMATSVTTFCISKSLQNGTPISVALS